MKIEIELNRNFIAGVVVAGALFGVGHVIAGEFPATANALAYSGVLTDASGVPRTTTETMSVALFAAEFGGVALCGSADRPINLAQNVGRFRLDLPAECVAAIEENGEVFAALTVGGTVFPRQRVGATAFAVVAKNAQTADVADVATNAQSAAAVANGSIGSAALQSGSVGSAAIAGNAVDSVRILDGSVASADLADNAVSAAKIVAGAITSRELAAGSIGEAQLATTVAASLTSHESRLDALDTAVSVSNGVLNSINGSQVRVTGTITLANTSTVAFPLQTAVFDRRSELNAAINAIEVDLAGTYLVASNFRTGPIADQCSLQVSPFINGNQAGQESIHRQSIASASADNIGAQMTYVYQLNAGARVTFTVRSSCTGTLVDGDISLVRLF